MEQKNHNPGKIAAIVGPFSRMAKAFGYQIPSRIADDLILLQFEQLRQLVPILYLTIAVNSVAGAVAAMGDFPLIYQLVFPAGLIVASGVRYLVWRNRKGKVSPKLARRHLRTTFVISLFLSLLGGLWTTSAYYETHETRRVLAAIFMTMSAFASANCLASFPRAAIASLVVGLAPISFAMLTTKDLGVQAVAVSILVGAMLQSRLVLSKFAETCENLALQHDMHQLANSDMLTGLPNRRAFFASVQEELDAGHPIAFALLDLNGFKPVNDRLGHQAGDELLQIVAERMELQTSPSILAGRIGGDEFALLIRNPVDRGSVDSITTGLLAALAQPCLVSGRRVAISASIGIASYPHEGGSLEELYLHADKALYAAKAEGGDRRRPAPYQRQAA